MTTRSFLSLEEKSRLVVKLLMPSFSASVPLDEALATTAGSYGIIVFKIDEDFVSHHFFLIMMSSVIVFFLMRAAVALLCVRRVRLLCAGKAQSKKRKLDNNNHQKVYSQ